MKNKDMEKENGTKMVVPALRFPEFQGVEGWGEHKLKMLCEIGNGRDYKHLGAGNIPVYGSGGYMTSVDDFLYDGESVCIGRKGTIDKPMFLTGKFWTVDTLFYTHSFHNCLPRFLYLIFQLIDWHRYNEAGGIPSLSKTTIGDIKVLVPVEKDGILKEQQKIADCFSSLDDLIEATNRKIEALKEHKKGLMQRLFPKDGENVPALRFPEFQRTKGWVEKKMKNLCSIGNGKDYKHLSKGDIPVYGSGGYMTSVNDFLYDGESVCIGRKGTIDRPIFITGKFWTVDTLFYTHSFFNCLPKFLYLIFQKIDWYKFNEAGGVPSLSKTTIGEINVFIPIEEDGGLKEQFKIVDCLFSLDELIEATSRKVEILKEHKKGLMQQLFPKI